jgi:hypothetical protein
MLATIAPQQKANIAVRPRVIWTVPPFALAAGELEVMANPD